MSTRAFVWPSVQLMAVLTAAIYFMYLPENDPEKTLDLESTASSLIKEVTTPIRIMKLAMQAPDATLAMPVYGVKTNAVNNSWGTARPGERSHEGQDIFARSGTPIFSATSGYVRRMRDTEIGGLNLTIKGAGGISYYYAHLDRFADGLKEGDWVTPDTVIGFVGNSGNAKYTPPHLHFGMYEKGEAINPYELFADRW